VKQIPFTKVEGIKRVGRPPEDGFDIVEQEIFKSETGRKRCL
jgi:hypothetical protein